jgi:nucleoside-diphosphate-sugar epimerase
VNLLGFITQLRAARDGGVKRVIAPASAAVYGESFYSHAVLNEATTPCVPTGVYGVTKYGIERTALRLGALWDIDVIAARIGSVFGPWERDTGLRDMIGPHWRLARAARDGEPTTLPSRIPPYTWVYSRDVAAALLHLLDMPDPPHRVFNICSSVPWGEVITRWADTLTTVFPGFAWRQGEHPTVAFSETRPRGRMDNGRLCATGWAPRFLPDAAYADYAAWLAADPARLDA